MTPLEHPFSLRVPSERRLGRPVIQKIFIECMLSARELEITGKQGREGLPRKNMTVYAGIAIKMQCVTSWGDFNDEICIFPGQGICMVEKEGFL